MGGGGGLSREHKISMAPFYANTGMQKRVPKQIFKFADKYQSKSRTREQNIDKGAYRQVERETEGCIYADQDRIELPTETFSAAISVFLVASLSHRATL